MRARAGLVRILAVVALGCVSACSTAPPGGGRAEEPRRASASEGVGAAALDLATMTGQWGTKESALESAMGRATDDCMKARGFRGPASDGVLENWDEGRDIGLERRRTQGYGLDPARSKAVDPEPRPDVDAYVAGLSKEKRLEYSNVLLGSAGPRLTVRLPGGRVIDTPLEGCVAEGRRRVFGTIENWASVQYVPEAINAAVDVKVMSSNSYGQALVAWRGCMSAKGIQASSPVELARSVEDDYSRHVPNTSAREVRVAVADGECALASHLGLAALAARRQLLQTSLDTQQRKLLNQATRLWLDAAAVSRS